MNFGEHRAWTRSVSSVESVTSFFVFKRQAQIILGRTALGGDCASVTLPSLVATKVQIYAAMRTQKVGKAELAKLLGAHLPQVDRLLDLKHGLKLDQLEAAAHALGAELEITLVKRPTLWRRMGSTPAKSTDRPIVHAGVLTAQKKSGATGRRSTSTGGAKKKWTRVRDLIRRLGRCDSIGC